MTGIILTLLLVASMHASPSGSAHTDDTYPSLGNGRIVIAQDTQRMLVYDGDKLFRSMPISTGWPGKRQTLTPAWRGEVGEYWGTFASFGTVQDDGYWLFTDYLPDGSWNGDILIHGAPYLLSLDGQKQYDLEGIGIAPVSHGCIRLLPIDMAWFRRWDPQGVAVKILPISEPTLTAPRLALGALLAGAASPPGR